MPNCHIVPRIDHKATAIQEVKLFLPKVYIDKKECEQGVSCLKNFRREWDDKNGCWKNSPRHDWAMHGYDGFESLVRGLNAYGTPGMIGDTQRRKMPAAPNWRAC